MGGKPGGRKVNGGQGILKIERTPRCSQSVGEHTDESISPGISVLDLVPYRLSTSANEPMTAPEKAGSCSSGSLEKPRMSPISRARTVRSASAGLALFRPGPAPSAGPEAGGRIRCRAP